MTHWHAGQGASIRITETRRDALLHLRSLLNYWAEQYNTGMPDSSYGNALRDVEKTMQSFRDGSERVVLADAAFWVYGCEKYPCPKREG